MPSPVDVGVDVAKDQLQMAYAARCALPVCVANRRAAIMTWLECLPPGSRIAMESTGGYHQQLADLAHTRGMIVYVLNAHDVWHYARGIGARGKTDRIDAEVILRYLVNEHVRLHAYTPPTAQQREIDQLLRRRATVVNSKTSLQLSFQGLSGWTKQWRATAKKLDGLIGQIDRRLRELAQHQAEAQTRVQSIVGVGPLVGTALTNLFSRVPLRNANAAVAFVGLDPRAKESGQFRGRRFLSKRGPGELRRLLFNAARSASKTKLWRPLYQCYRARGLSTTEATVILARKLLRIAFSISRHGGVFDAAKLKQA
jgi:transposase